MRWSRRPSAGVKVSLLVDGFGAVAGGLLPAAGGGAGALLPVRAALGAALSAAQPPEAGAGRRRQGDDRRLQHLQRLFRDDRIRRLARPRPAGRGAQRLLPGRVFRGGVRMGREARRLDPAPAARALPEQHERRRRPLAVRRADPAAQPLGAIGEGRSDARAERRHHLLLFRAEPFDAAPAVRSGRARAGCGSSRRPSSTISS